MKEEDAEKDMLMKVRRLQRMDYELGKVRLDSDQAKQLEKEMYEILRSIKLELFEEYKIEQGIKTLIAKAKPEFIQIIKDEADLKGETKKAAKIVEDIQKKIQLVEEKNWDAKIAIHMLEQPLNKLESLLMNEIKVSEAMKRLTVIFYDVIRQISSEE